MDIWIPKHKWQLVEWLRNRYPDVKWERRNKKQLYAVYFSVRRGA
jgi:hypothetical protein